MDTIQAALIDLPAEPVPPPPQMWLVLCYCTTPWKHWTLRKDVYSSLEAAKDAAEKLGGNYTHKKIVQIG